MAESDLTKTTPAASTPPNRSGDGILKHVALAFFLALALYGAAYSWIESKRNQKGPWRVLFQTDAQGRPSVTVLQSNLSISNVNFAFPDSPIEKPNLTEWVVFDSPITNVPFGKVVFLDTTFLPGTLTLDLFGHEIELLPRTLVVDRTERPWKSGETIEFRQQRR